MTLLEKYWFWTAPVMLYAVICWHIVNEKSSPYLNTFTRCLRLNDSYWCFCHFVVLIASLQWAQRAKQHLGATVSSSSLTAVKTKQTTQHPEVCWLAGADPQRGRRPPPLPPARDLWPQEVKAVAAWRPAVTSLSESSLSRRVCFSKWGPVDFMDPLPPEK